MKPKRWLVLVILALVLAALAFTAPRWLPVLLGFVGANAELIQGLDSLVQLILVVGSLVLGLVGILQGRRQAVAALNPSVAARQKSIAIGRDVSDSTIINVETMLVAEKFWHGLHPAIAVADLQAATRVYLVCLLDRHRYLNFKGMGVSDRVPLRLALLDLYVPLSARLELPEGETWQRQLRLAGRPLAEAEEHGALRLSEPQPVLKLLQEHPGLVILGDPGAGKTTFLKYLALCMAAGAGAQTGLGQRLPILAPLSAYANTLEQADVRLDDFIADYFHDAGADLPVGAMLAEALRAGKALILLDGLDEVKDLRLRNIVVERVTDFYTFQRRAGNKFVLTSRIIGYRLVRPSAEGLVECTLVDFDAAEIADFIEHWTAALEKQAAGATQTAAAEAQREHAELLEAIQRNPGVRQLAANPLLLTILALMKRQGVTLPERRVELYNQYVRTLLSTWNRARSLSGRAPGRDLDVERTLRILAPLALWMHQASPGAGLVRREDLRRKLEELFAGRGEADPPAAAGQFLQDVRDLAALLLERGPEQYGFIHLTFEEYLAAAAVALEGQGSARPIADFLSQHVGDQAWREVSMLVVSYLGLIQQLDTVAGEVVELLAAEQPGAPGEAVVLAGEAVLDAWPVGVPPASKEKVVGALLGTMQDSRVPASLRRRAGLTLGRLGWLPPDLDAFCEVPAGEFLYGDDRQAQSIPYRYWIARYPLANAQYARFIAAGGYEQAGWWSREGWAWRWGKYDSQATQKVEKDWLARRPVERRDRPFYWEDHDLNNPIFPLVGVTWFEAQAYCNWLSAQQPDFLAASGRTARPSEYVFRLPDELEWERAARGVDGRDYPWGAPFDPAFAHTAEGHPEDRSGFGTTAVCTYPQGAAACGAWDLSGNVWEWTSSWYDKQRRYRVLRGGSWWNEAEDARCAVRGWDIPDGFGNGYGFRVVVSLACSDS